MEHEERLKAALADRYQIEREIGSGGMATVYLAQDLKHDRKVAVKVLKPELAAVVGKELFLDEIRTTANITHPNILPLFDSGTTEGSLFYVMPYVEGETLRQRLDRAGQLPLEEGVRIAGRVADALDYAHRQGIVHRDIKPANILFEDDQPVVADFGIALAVSTAGEGRLTETGLSLGSPYYMSPEQAAGDESPSAASDVYSLGCVLYEMLTGDPPHTGGSAQAILGKILLGEVTRPTKLRHTIPAHVEGTILKALERLPADRFGSAAELAGALHDTSFRHGAGVGQGTGEGHIWQRWTWGLSALAVILTGVAVWGWARSLPREVNRFYLSLPGDSGLAPRYGPSVALSPDGTKLVYVGPGEDGGYALWLKETGQLHPRLLQGTDGAFQPFFSPDGERIGFIAAHDGAARAVMITAVSGGLPTVVVDSMLRRGGASWGRDGFIYVLAEDSILRRIPATGGALTPITTLKEGENFHSWPEVLPNGRGVLFTVLRHGPYNFEDATIAVADLSTGEHRDLVLGAYARYAESGHLVVVGSEGTLSAAPFDEEKLEVTGMFTALAEGLDLPDGRGMEGGTDLALSSSGTAIYAEEPEEGGGNMALVWVERDGTERFIKRDWGYAFGSLALSPDGTRLAVSVSHDSGTTYQIWILPLDGSVPLQLTFEEAEDDFPVWTPDGREVTFNSSRSGTSQLYSKPWDGSAPAKPIPGADSWVWEGRWLPDGESILVTQIEGEESDLDLLVLRPGDGETAAGFLVTEANEHSPTISPSGDWVAYVSDETGEDEVFVRPFPGPGERRRVSQGGGQEPLWSHGGGEIFFRSPEGMMVAEVSISPTFTVHTRRVLFSDQIYSRWAIHTQYDITPDDQCFVMIRQGPGNLGRLVMVQNFFQELEERIGR